MSGARDDLTASAFRLAWRLARAVPEPVALTLAERAADRVHARGGTRVEQLRANLRRARPQASPAELDDLVHEGLRSYARYWCDVFRLPAWSRERTTAGVRASGAEPLLEQLRSGRGAVLFLGHLGNWDHAAAWWSASGLSRVVTVAERLRPEAVFTEFLAFRRRLGVEVLPLGDPGTFPALVRGVRAGAVVPLLADRDLSGSGVPVRFLGETLPMAAGPATLALAAGVPLFPAAVWYEGPPSRPRTLVVEVGEEVRRPPADPARPAREDRAAAVAAMTQGCADALDAAVRAHPQDWHVLQPVFPADVARGGARGGTP
ncbi:phosphatidylinositol mannoside acyltransferase [Paenibacillus sp. TRM 82003]|uniref:phosphatidylinositol mannoside acyltransferase n=1 Tax=Kineococcus sp. TRM81007 TaxID=2925831 RepID=UPI001F5911F4|nr:phosphatidylinositol mannoside acyltransferase [Kineococcus sp. TRM81007]MCI2238973.1 phosphatidylinositol mannoside acyltransferase [Kineococcus sp. TRM81007]MCI3924393.1 phosphatidylinositol mannoside acyltransferase [Paenibacillus sp. TRM 82003]